MVKINSIPQTATFAWSNDSIPILATGTAAGVIDDDFSSTSSLSFYSLYEKEPILSVDSAAKFHDLDWSSSNNLLAGALENGSVQFWNTSKLASEGNVQAVATNKKHAGLVKALSFSKVQSNVLASGGSNGEIFIYDTNKIDNLEPFAPGTAMTPMDVVSSVSWNNSMGHILASAGSAGYTSVWDLRAKKEVLHLSYTNNAGSRAVLSTVAWHPTQSTRLVTASEADGAPVILTWDLRNSNAPLKTLEGHKKGVLSLDWNSRDSNLLLSSGKDNTTILWNPETAEMLAQYPTTANWVFKSRFAPSTPDVFAAASFDKKVVIQTLQDTSPPVSTETQTSTETDFWSNISEVETQHPKYFAQQAPNWYGRHSSVAFGFGGKLITVAKTGDKTSEIKITKAKLPGSQENTALNAALDSQDFNSIIESRLSDSFENVNKADWELLKTLDGTSDVFEKFIALAVEDSAEAQNAEDEDFFNNLKDGQVEYTPSGDFKFEAGSEELVAALLTKNLSKAVGICLKEGKVVEALIIAQNGPDSLKKQVTDHYFAKTATQDPVSRLLYSISKNSVTDLVENGDVNEWKKIANAIKTYSANDETFKAQFRTLGDRVLHSQLSNRRDQAILNYISASALDKVADIWVSELKELESKILETKKTSIYDAHFDSLTEFVEKFSAYRTSLKLSSSIDESSPLLSTILEYISIISTSGQFELAKKFLALLPDSPAVKLEKSRIEKALGVSAVRSTVGATGAARYGSLANNGLPTAASTVNRARPGIASNPYLNNVAPVAPVYGQAPLPQAHPAASPAANPYAPQQAAASINPYKPVAPVNPYKPEAPQPIATAPPGASGPPKIAGKVTTDGWNDLPSTFHKTPARRTTPAAPVALTQQPNVVAPTPAGPPSMNRQTSFNAPQLPPPPTSKSRVSSSQVPSPQPASTPSTPAVNSRYAPTQSPQLNNVTPAASQPPVVASAPPRNPYAPTGQQAPSSSPYPQLPTPPTNQYAPSPAFQQPAPVNPYAPAPGAVATPPAGPHGAVAPPPINAYGSSSNLSGPTAPAAALAPPVNPYAPASLPTQPHNPYGAPSMPQHQFQQQPNQYGSLPPPPQSNGTASAYGAPPLQTSAPPQFQSQAPAPVEPVKPKHPSGDRSHIPASEMKIFQVLSSEFETAKPNIPEKFSKQIIDTEKRLNILFDHLNNEELLSAAAIADLHQVVDLLEKKEFGAALELQVALMSNHTHESANWGTGVKRLIQFAEATV
ncbi:hypothetical protein WICPIJ_005338 [Wickerhamomyces pijperi]|uniref:Protein transport protein SEC31 n=1 Tax=Wickerhamomyces pijperi TaxID=599730 RepID=A0A9P8Q6D0_WICPI|nr:hypothetical protein WICPIJ_005338 [Wickerhamomyces pijperi]